MADLSQFNVNAASDAGYDLVLLSPFDDSETDMVIKVRGDHSALITKLKRKHANEFQVKEKVQAGKQKAGTLDFDFFDDKAQEMFVARVISWKNIQENGVDLPCTKENVLAIGEKYQWIREQVAEAAQDVRLFRPE